MTQAPSIRRRVVDAVTMALVTGMSLALLIYVGYGEAQRTFEQLYLEKAVAQNKVVQGAVEGFLRRNLPLKQYVGFSTRAERILASDSTIAAMTVFDEDDRPIFASGDASIDLLPRDVATRVATNPEAETRRSDAYLQVVLPLSNRYEQVGSLAITMPTAVISDQVRASFEPLLAPAAVLSLLFAVFVGVVGPRLAQDRVPWLHIGFATIFVGYAVIVIGTLVALYSAGVQAKTKALADSLGQRLTQIVRYDLDLDQIAGLDEAFNDYRRLNTEISAAALTVDGEIVIHTDPVMVGEPWVSQRNAYEYVVDITPPGSAQTIRTAVTLPADIVYRRIARSVKNFAALFVASAFLAGVFLKFAGSMHFFGGRPARTPEGGGALDEGYALNLVKPVFYIAMCVEHLTYSFLPQFTHDAVARAGWPSSLASAIFMLYYLAFALTLIPAGHYAERIGQRPFMTGGLALTAAGLLTLMLPLDVLGVALGRMLGGVGQGMLFIGVQSYVLAVASPARRTQGAAIIVFGFQGGMISGMAIGSLLVTHIGADGVFALGATTAMAMALYAAVVVPGATIRQIDHIGLKAHVHRLAREIRQTLRDPELLRTIALIGIPAKAVLTGVILFALPLLMTHRDYAQEDIGQVLMVYAAGVVAASGYASRLVDRTRTSRLMLFVGAAVSGLGLALIALIGSKGLGAMPYAAAVEVIVLVAGVAIVGLAHGLINAPVVTHVAELDIARRIGAGSATATYRFLERAGHVAGPMIVGLLFLHGGQDPVLLAWIGLAVVGFGLLFLLPRRRSASPIPGLGGAGSGNVVGLYLDPPDAALVVAARSHGRATTGDIGVDERIRAPSAPPRIDDHGGARSRTAMRQRAQRFLWFLDAVDDSNPSRADLHLLLGQSLPSAVPVVREWLAAHPRFRVHPAATGAEWYARTMEWLSFVAKSDGTDEVRNGARRLALAIAERLQAGDSGTEPFVWVAAGGETIARPDLQPVPAAGGSEDRNPWLDSLSTRIDKIA